MLQSLTHPVDCSLVHRRAGLWLSLRSLQALQIEAQFVTQIPSVVGKRALVLLCEGG